MPPLPDGLAAADAAPPDTGIAFALAIAHAAHEAGAAPPAGLGPFFTRKLALLIDAALAAGSGDPAFQATVLRASDAQAAAYALLAAQAPADRREVRARVNTLAHPARLQHMPAGPLRDALGALHGLLLAEDWDGLDTAAGGLLRQPFLHEPARAALQALVAGEPLRRLRQAAALQAHASVRRFRALCEQRGPAAGTRAAAAQGRAAARVGELAERATAEAFHALARLLDAHADDARYRALRGLRTPAGFPGEAGKAKDEWDAAIVREQPAQAAALVLLAEVKAAPAAATPDFARLHRGLQRLARAEAGAHYAFPAAEGEVRLAGASLRALQPPARALPPQVIYCCSAPPEAQPAMLSAASKAVLLAEPASVDFARRRLQGEAAAHAVLAPVWHALPTASRLRSALQQYATAQAVREAMLHPDDLLGSAREVFGRGAS